MSVSRRGKRGTRAGHMIPESRNRRVRRNAGLKRTAGTDDWRPTKGKMSKEEWVIRCVARAVGAAGGRNYVAADDIASDIILWLLDAGGFHWEEDQIAAFCYARARWAVIRFLGRKEVSECEFEFVSDDGERNIVDVAGSVPPNQDTVYDAHYAERCLKAIPDKQRQALEVLCDGGNPIDVAEEMEITPWAAIALIKEGREYVDRVDPVP